MIVVLADDFSGAAEIAGIASRYGLTSLLQTDLDLSLNYDVIIVDTNTRSKNKNEARQINKKISPFLSSSKISWIFKKVDSVLRGHIIAEIEPLARELKINKILIVANNPSSGKIIKGNMYFIGDRKLHQTEFGNDPEFPINTSVVTEILGSSQIFPLLHLDQEDSMLGQGIFIPEITKSEDIVKRAITVDKNTLPAGGSEFFKTLLEFKGYRASERHIREEKNQNGKRFFVLTSTSEQSRKLCLKLKIGKIPVCDIPCKMSDISDLTDDCLQRWVNNIRLAFRENRSVVSTVMHPVNRQPGFPQTLNQFISGMIKEVLEKVELDELLVEGGATTSNLVRFLGWRNFTLLKEYSTGVVKLRIDNHPDCRLIVKPGSYHWPDHFFTS